MLKGKIAFDEYIQTLENDMKNKILAFVDTETTGLDVSPTGAEVIEFTVILEKNGKIIDRVTHKVKPSRIELAHPKALEINGYSEKNWENALDKETACFIIEGLLCGNKKDLVVIGHNVAFDRNGLNALLKETGSKKYITHRVFDTQALVYEHLIDLGLKSTSLDAVREFLGWSKDKAHTAEKDTEDCRKLFHKLYQAGMLKRLWWKLTLAKKK
jgi:DNA polymerase III epsilon subunit-like protein